MNDPPLISVIVPVWNGANFLRQAVSNILAQHYTPLEIIVIDDGSTDGTAAIAAELQQEICCLAFPHRGLPAAREAGIAHARGDLIAFLDVDDLWTTDKTRLQLALLQQNPDVKIVNGYTQLMRLVETNEQGMRFEIWGEPMLAFSFGSALIRREVFGMVRSFDTTTASTVDLDWFMQVREQGIPMLTHRDVVQYYRRHGKNMTNDQDLGKRSLLFMLRDSLVRRNLLGVGGESLPPIRVRQPKMNPEDNS